MVEAILKNYTEWSEYWVHSTGKSSLGVETFDHRNYIIILLDYWPVIQIILHETIWLLEQ